MRVQGRQGAFLWRFALLLVRRRVVRNPYLRVRISRRPAGLRNLRGHSDNPLGPMDDGVGADAGLPKPGGGVSYLLALTPGATLRSSA